MAGIVRELLLACRVEYLEAVTKPARREEEWLAASSTAQGLSPSRTARSTDLPIPAELSRTHGCTIVRDRRCVVNVRRARSPEMGWICNWYGGGVENCCVTGGTDLVVGALTIAPTDPGTTACDGGGDTSPDPLHVPRALVYPFPHRGSLPWSSTIFWSSSGTGAHPWLFSQTKSNLAAGWWQLKQRTPWKFTV